MKTFSLIATLITGLAVGSCAYADDDGGYRNNRNYHSNHDHRQHRGHKHRSHRNRSYQSRRGGNYSGFNSPYRQGQYRDRDYYDSRDYRRGYKKHRRNRGYYNNYRPYRSDRYRYRPTRGLGHYFNRDNYGYGHWHNNMWCDVYHPASFYVDYYSNYPYDGGWAIGDGDFGIHFYLN